MPVCLFYFCRGDLQLHSFPTRRSSDLLDPSRVAIWGWSGGGSSTLQAMVRYPDVYQVGMSVAPVPDERLYDTIYQERQTSDRKSTRLNSSHSSNSYAVFCLKHKKHNLG